MRKSDKQRRSFLKSSLTLAGGALLGTSYLSGMPMSFGQEEVKIGVIGTGDRGKGLIRLMSKISGLKVVACADVIPFRLDEALAMAKGAKGYSHHHELLADANVDAVIIATPFSTHDEIALAAIGAGKHVYCEKTMTRGIAETQQVISASIASGLVFQTGHQYHSSPLYNRAKDIIQSGYIGEVTAYECQWNRNGNWRRPVPDPKWERMINWRMYREYSGGLVAELMSHQIDFINWVSNSHPNKVVGFGGIDHWKDGRETFDNVHLLFEYPNGMDASFTCTTTNGYEDYQIKVLGSDGTIILDYTRGTVYAERKGLAEKGLVDGVSGATLQAWNAGQGTPIDAPGNDPTLDALRQFYDAIANGKEVISDIKTGAITAKCVQISLDALYQNEIKNWDDYPNLQFS